MRAEVNRTTGRFRIVVMRSGGSARRHPESALVRVQAAGHRADMNISVGVTISPPAPSLAGNVTQVLTATVSNGRRRA